MEVTITGIDAVNLALQKIGPEAIRAAQRGMKIAGMNIIADAKETLRRENINATGVLSQSGKVQPVKGDPEGLYDVGFMGEKAYAGAVEYGRRAGGPPPKPSIVQWLRKKHSMKRNGRAIDAITSAAAFTGKSREQLMDAAADNIRWHIAKHGTKPHPFFKPAVDKNTPSIPNLVAREVGAVINRTGNV